MVQKTLAKILIIGSISAWLVEKLNPAVSISDILGKLACQDQYLLPVNDVIGDVSCGFNADMYLAVGLLITLLIGIVLLLLVKQKSQT
ncbi:MAG: hypothetical protein V3V09_01540 [Arenicellales bacterium]